MPNALRSLAIAGFVLGVGTTVASCTQTSHSLPSPSSAAVVAPAESMAKAKSLSPRLAEVPATYQAYVPIDLETLRPEQSLIGSDPQAIAVQLLSPIEPVEGHFKQIVETQQVQEKMIVTLTQTGLPDDSIQGMRYYLEFVPLGEQWRLVWAGKQYTCQPGRGSQTWSTEWCF